MKLLNNNGTSVLPKKYKTNITYSIPIKTFSINHVNLTRILLKEKYLNVSYYHKTSGLIVVAVLLTDNRNICPCLLCNLFIMRLVGGCVSDNFVIYHF